MTAPAVTYGAFLVYVSDSELEGEPKTRAGANRMIAKLRRLGFKYITLKRHATDGVRHWNEVIPC